jgi:hypothetical protein
LVGSVEMWREDGETGMGMGWDEGSGVCWEYAGNACTASILGAYWEYICSQYIPSISQYGDEGYGGV